MSLGIHHRLRYRRRIATICGGQRESARFIDDHSRVADDPAVERGTPRRCEHHETDKHDEGILDETKLSANPVTFYTDEDLTNNDTWTGQHDTPTSGKDSPMI